MKLAMIGVGNVGANLGATLARAGNEVVYGVREGKDISELLSHSGARAKGASVAEAAREGQVVFLAVPGNVAVDVIKGLPGLEGKILVDCNNAVGWDDGPTFSPPEGHPSLAAAIQAAAPAATVVKAFNTFGAELHADPSLSAGAVDVYLAGDDAKAVKVVAGLAEGAGFCPVASGPLRNAALLENLAILWIHLATKGGRGRETGFKLLSR